MKGYLVKIQCSDGTWAYFNGWHTHLAETRETATIWFSCELPAVLADMARLNRRVEVEEWKKGGRA